MAKKQKEVTPLTPMEEYIHKVCGSYMSQFPMGNVLLAIIGFTYLCISMIWVDSSKPFMESGIIKYVIVGAVVFGIAIPVALKMNKKQKNRPELVKKYITTRCDNEDFIKVDSVFAQLLLYKEPTEEEISKAVECRNNCFLSGEFDFGKLQYYALFLNAMKKKYGLGPEFTVVIERSKQYAEMMGETIVQNPMDSAPVYESVTADTKDYDTVKYEAEETLEEASEEISETAAAEKTEDSKFDIAAKRRLCTMIVMQLKAQFPNMIVDQTNLQKNIEMMEKEYRKIRNLSGDIKIYDPLNGWIHPEFITFLAGFISCNKKKVFKL